MSGELFVEIRWFSLLVNPSRWPKLPPHYLIAHYAGLRERLRRESFREWRVKYGGCRCSLSEVVWSRCSMSRRGRSLESVAFSWQLNRRSGAQPRVCSVYLTANRQQAHRCQWCWTWYIWWNRTMFIWQLTDTSVPVVLNIIYWNPTNGWIDIFLT